MACKRTIVFFFSFFFAAVSCLAQVTVPTDTELEKMDDEQRIETAEYLLDKKMYLQSLRIWKRLLKDYPDNARINYMAGKSKILSGKEKEKSLQYFEKTIGRVSNKLTLTGNQDEVPADALFYMGQASHLNNKFDDALVYYQQYLDKAGTKLSEDDKKEVERWKQWSTNAKTMTAKPDKTIHITNLGPGINTPDEEYSPVLSLDENVIYFTSRRLRPDSSNANVIMGETGQYYEDVYLSFKNDDSTWSKPKLMNFGNEADDNEATVSVSADGTEVYVYVDTEGGGDLYNASFLESGYNAELEHMEGEINSPYWETHCSLTPDGQTMFFTSNRPGGMGGLDIYRVVKLPNQQWSRALILPAPINTPYDEDAPYIHPTGTMLYYSSNNPKSMGGCDVFYSRILEPNPLVFSEPRNMGYPINTADDDVFFVMDAAGQHGYYSSAQNGGYGGHDIFMIEFANNLRESFAILKGRVMTSDGSPVPDNIVVNVLNETQPEEPLKYKPRPFDGRFVMALKPCNEYEIVYNKGTDQLRKEKIRVPCDSDYKEFYTEIRLDSITVPGTEAVAVNKNKTENNVSSVPVSNETLVYEKYFDYNMYDAAAEQSFAAFVDKVAQRLATGKTEVTIESSASRVPTTTFKTNDKLSRSRSNEAKEKLVSALKAKGADTSKLKVKKINALVQGPVYKDDYLENREVYGKYQYVKIWVK